MLEKINQILDVWFQFDDCNSNQTDPVPLKHWQLDNDELDEKLSEFEDLYYLAVHDKLRLWWDQPRSCLAFILLTHAFAVRIYRDSPIPYENSLIALDASDYGRAHKLDKELPLIHRYFFYQPYYHAESISSQRLGLVLLSQMIEQAKQLEPHWVPFLEAEYSHQVDNYDIILNFGRFPQRNQLLDRESTQEELLFLGLPNNQC